MKAYALAFLFLVTALSGCGQAENVQFQNARTLVTQGKYQDAIPALEDFLKNHSRDKNASRAGLFLFKSHMAVGNLDQARKWCESTIQDYPDSLEAHKCHYKLAMIAMLQGRQGIALEEFEAIADKPDGPLAAEAVAMVRFLKANRIEPLER